MATILRKITEHEKHTVWRNGGKKGNGKLWTIIIRRIRRRDEIRGVNNKITCCCVLLFFFNWTQHHFSPIVHHTPSTMVFHFQFSSFPFPPSFCVFLLCITRKIHKFVFRLSILISACCFVFPAFSEYFHIVFALISFFGKDTCIQYNPTTEHRHEDLRSSCYKINSLVHKLLINVCLMNLLFIYPEQKGYEGVITPYY